MYEFLPIATVVLIFSAGLGWAFCLIDQDRHRTTEVKLETDKRGIAGSG